MYYILLHSLEFMHLLNEKQPLTNQNQFKNNFSGYMLV